MTARPDRPSSAPAGDIGAAARQSSPFQGAVTGLTGEQVNDRILEGHANTAPIGSARTVAQILRANLLTRFNAILGSLLVVVAFVGPPQDALFGVVLVVNAAIGITQELRAKHTLDRLTVLTAPIAHVRRSGELVEIAVEQIVLDDIFELYPGDQVVVDGIVLSSAGLEVDESLLTGEAEPASKAPTDEVLSGSFVVAGSGVARASRVGVAAYAQSLQVDARRFDLVRSELVLGTNRILAVVTWVMVPAAALLVTSQLLRSGQSVADALRGSVAGVAAMVPEGLVLLTTIAFAVGAIRLAGRRVLVQELGAIEGLARVDVVCIDKTGTLTEPGMTLEHVEMLGNQIDESSLRAALGAIAASDPAPNATLEAIAIACPPPREWRSTDRVPFSSARKWSATTFAEHGTWILGAPDLMLGHLRPGSPSVPDLDGRAAIGQRSLLVARTEPFVGDVLPSGSLEPVGLVFLDERVRRDAESTIRYLLDQGVTPKVLSGDDPRTVAAVAARVGIPRADAPVDARDLPDDPDVLIAVLEEASVFGRVQPQQKRAMVKALQAAGHVVAMTGDGVNDVPALKQADIGIAMGTGSQASRSVGRIILLDSSFAALPNVLDEGRRVIANIERVANLFVTKTVYAAVLAIVVGAVGVAFPFYPRHLTVVSTLTIGVPGFFLALAAGAPRALPGYTRRVAQFTLRAGVVTAASTFAAYAVARATPHTSGTQARTAATIVLLCLGLWVLVCLARPLDVVRMGLVIAMAGGAALALTLPVSKRVFAFDVPSLSTLMITLAVATGGAMLISVLLGRVTSRRPWWAPGASSDLQTNPPPPSGRGIDQAETP